MELGLNHVGKRGPRRWKFGINLSLVMGKQLWGRSAKRHWDPETDNLASQTEQTKSNIFNLFYDIQ